MSSVQLIKGRTEVEAFLALLDDSLYYWPKHVVNVINNSELPLWLSEQLAKGQNTTSVSTRVIRLKTHKAVGIHSGKAQNHYGYQDTRHRAQNP